jgi:hypothetical protein
MGVFFCIVFPLGFLQQMSEEIRKAELKSCMIGERIFNLSGIRLFNLLREKNQLFFPFERGDHRFKEIRFFIEY